MTDTELLDYLDKLHRKSGYAWCVLRASTTGRGWRLHSIPFPESQGLGVDVYPTPRQAIEAVAASEKGLKF